MRIAQVAPLNEAVPPLYYGGTERVVSYLTEELVAQGHDVTLFASADSVTSARLVACAPRALRLDSGVEDRMVHHLLQLEEVQERAAAFDVVHYHCDYIHYSWGRRAGVPVLTTLHGRQDIPDLAALYREFDDLPLVSISESQRQPIPWAGWVGTVQHGLPPGLLQPGGGAGGYLAFLGRFSPEKGFPRAVEVARRTGLRLRAAAKVEAADRAYFEAEIRPLLADPLVEWVGEVSEADKSAFLGDALALLFPIDWNEPFGLVMIEAMACGTPTIAWDRGAVPEVIEPGLSGFVVGSVDEAVAAVARCRGFDRAACRAAFEDRFTAARMAADYVSVYRRLAARWRTPLRPAIGGA
ncbi:glycosyltransferase family 4 protein [Magnetospirillum sp. UT-4]|uniref:glycosyltransferase family 4 protein n=1 Tax=Magnetospirillum sp. UT-4 TaxID=2681467 RepID=UPI00137F2B5F|nr:glycosyltransferase family 4 protein [Magnetospirillum sp. UT-4]CAA7613881.1 Glycosyl transferase group 1 [Magnetospirillum sp. UT-4]